MPGARLHPREGRLHAILAILLIASGWAASSLAVKKKIIVDKIDRDTTLPIPLCSKGINPLPMSERTLKGKVVDIDELKNVLPKIDAFSPDHPSRVPLEIKRLPKTMTGRPKGLPSPTIQTEQEPAAYRSWLETRDKRDHTDGLVISEAMMGGFSRRPKTPTFPEDLSPPPRVQAKLKSVTDALTKQGIAFEVKRSPGYISVEERGFDVVQHFFAKTHTTYRPPDERPNEVTAMIYWRGSEGHLTYLSGNDVFSEYIIENTGKYAPFYLLSGYGERRLLSTEDITSMSFRFTGDPVDLGDGWALLSRRGSNTIIAKTGNPANPILRMYGTAEVLGNKLTIATHHGMLTLPLHYTVAALEQQDYLSVEGARKGSHRLVSKVGMKSTPTFLGEPIDYGRSLLLDLGNGFQLVAKDALDKSSSKFAEILWPAAAKQQAAPDWIRVITHSGNQRWISTNDLTELPAKDGETRPPL